ncbi:MAG: hypothetical protein J0H99_06395, partial [Rhodospirillales bacterium]|nr:hypothetical protein [Rhodospirillales bacterium]
MQPQIQLRSTGPSGPRSTRTFLIGPIFVIGPFLYAPVRPGIGSRLPPPDQHVVDRQVQGDLVVGRERHQ